MGQRIHVNRGIAWQVRCAAAMEAGGFDCEVILGPHHQIRRSGALMVERAYWGDPESVRIGWLMPDGSLHYASGKAPRAKPYLTPWKTREVGAVVLGGYGEDVRELVRLAREHFAHVYYRHHPADKPRTTGVMKLQGHLEDCWAIADVAIGTSTTALHAAVIAGLPTIGQVGADVASDWGQIRRPDRAAWLHDLSYRQFTYDEIRNGTAWTLLQSARPQ